MFSLFVGDLTPEVDDGMLYEFFYNRYPSCRGGKVVLDSMGNSKWVLTCHHTIWRKYVTNVGVYCWPALVKVRGATFLETCSNEVGLFPWESLSLYASLPFTSSVLFTQSLVSVMRPVRYFFFFPFLSGTGFRHCSHSMRISMNMQLYSLSFYTPFK